MLQIGGYINLLISVGHLVGLLWAAQMFEVTGIGKEMQRLSQIDASLPYLLTVFVAVVFFIFGLYGLSAAGKFKQLPLLKLGIFTIAGIYLLRGIGELVFGLAFQEAHPYREAMYSLIAVAIGLLYLLGGLRKWRLKKSLTRK
ncbi:MAG: hypothetical protein ACFB0B_16300 [Thermonemataceae bacterium]